MWNATLIGEPPLDDQIDLHRQTEAAQTRAEQAGFPATAATLARIADMIAGMIADVMAPEASTGRGMALPFAPRAATPSAGTLPIGRQARR
jgi:hypothetical protein